MTSGMNGTPLTATRLCTCNYTTATMSFCKWVTCKLTTP